MREHDGNRRQRLRPALGAISMFALRRIVPAAGVTSGLGAAAITPALAQAKWPTGPVRMVVPFSPGGPTDMIARLLSVKLSEQLGQQFVVENRAGANANIGAELVARSPADGQTLLYNTSSIVLSRALYAKLGYDLFKDFAPVALVASVPMLLAVNPGLPAKTFAEFVSLAKADPGKLTYASPGNGNVGHLASDLITRAVGVQATHIAYKGSAPALTDVASGQVNFMTDSVNSIGPFVKEGRLRALAVTSEHRLAAFPDTPTLRELGVKGVEVGVWQGVLAPFGTPEPIVARLAAEIGKALADPDTQAKLAAQSAEAAFLPEAKYAAFLDQETRRWTAAVKEIGLTLQ